MLTSFLFVCLTAQYFSQDQVLNIHSFSILRLWLKLIQNIAPVGDHSPLVSATGSNSASIENLTEFPSADESSSQGILNQSSLDNISVGSQTSAGFIIPFLRSSPQETGSRSPTQSPIFGISPGGHSLLEGSDSRPQTPLNFLAQPGSDDTRVRTQIPSPILGRSQRSMSTISFSKLFPSSQHGTKSGEQLLKEGACEYCLRLLEQSERSKNEQEATSLYT